MSEDEGASGNELAELLKPFWSLAHTAEALGVDEAGLERARAAGDVLALTPSGTSVPVFPVWQFVRTDGVVRVWSGLQRMLRVLKEEDPWSVAVILKASGPVPELGGRSVLEVVHEGGSDEELERFAELLRREWR